VSRISKQLADSPQNLQTCVLSIDDLYYPHTTLQTQAEKYPSNKLIQHRGQPGTHDVDLGMSVFLALWHHHPNIKIPSYDKSAHNGKGDRLPEDEWQIIDGTKVDVVLFEGWCVGFRALPEEELEQKWNLSKSENLLQSQLRFHELEDIKWVNDKLKKYNGMMDLLDALIFLSAADLQFVYEWRLQQERHLRVDRGSGMTDDEVIAFVNGYYPAYELYTDGLKSDCDEPADSIMSALIYPLGKLCITVDQKRLVTQVTQN
jgi:D-glycerate 3-kinase